jgi:hypothetical protein
MLREARDRASRVKFDLEKARLTAEQEKGIFLPQSGPKFWASHCWLACQLHASRHVGFSKHWAKQGTWG